MPGERFLRGTRRTLPLRMRSSAGSRAALTEGWVASGRSRVTCLCHFGRKRILHRNSAIRLCITRAPRVAHARHQWPTEVGGHGGCGVARSAHALSRIATGARRDGFNCGVGRTPQSGWQFVGNGNDSNRRTLERPSVPDLTGCRRGRPKALRRAFGPMLLSNVRFWQLLRVRSPVQERWNKRKAKKTR